jgi:hypothetical protein
MHFVYISHTNREVAGSIPDDLMEFFVDVILPAATMAPVLTQSLTEMSNRNASLGSKEG